MSGVYVKGFRLPEKNDLYYVKVECEPGKNPVATIWRKDVLGSMSFGVFECIPVPDHGDLIDRHNLKHKKITIDYDEWDDTFDDGLLFTTGLIDNAPTIIPADKEGEK